MQCAAPHRSTTGMPLALAANAEKYMLHALALPTFFATFLSNRKHLQCSTLRYAFIT